MITFQLLVPSLDVMGPLALVAGKSKLLEAGSTLLATMVQRMATVWTANTLLMAILMAWSTDMRLPTTLNLRRRCTMLKPSVLRTRTLLFKDRWAVTTFETEFPLSGLT